jgi:riboflavin kinase / FMN adenylyltransferase
LSVERHGSLEALPANVELVATIGAFDGVHRGHAALAGRLVREARARSAEAVVVTFEPHPAAVLRGAPPARLCDPAERDARLADLGVDHLVVERFDADLAAQTAETFVGRIGSGRRLVALLMTAATAFGRGRGGTLLSMRVLGVAEGFSVVEAPELRAGGEVISSSRIRAAIGLGRLAEARRLLGRPYAVTGTVVRGDGRGRWLGFPTANLAFDDPVALPPNGIYAARVAWGNDPMQPERQADGVASLGVRPTFGVGGRVLEVFLLDTDEDLYDRRLRLVFVRRQRGERRFSNAERLVEQMERDVVRARQVLAAATT